MNDERRKHGAVDEPSSEQQIRESDDHTLIVRKNWRPTTSGTGSYGRLAGRLAGWLADEILLNSEIFKTVYRMKYYTFCKVTQR